MKTIFGEHIRPRIDLLLVQQIVADQMVADFIGRVAQLMTIFLAASAKPRRQMAKRLRLRMGNTMPMVSLSVLVRMSSAMS